MKQKKYNLYTDLSIIKNSYVELLIPVLGNSDKNEEDPDFQRFARLTDLGKDFVALTDDPKEADFFVYPVKWSPTLRSQSSSLYKFLDLASKHNKKTLIFFNDDSAEDLGLDNYDVAIFRTSFYRSSQKTTELAIPGWSNDSGQLPLRHKQEIPTIGFCGCYNNNQERYYSLVGLDSDKSVKTNFVLHAHAWGASNIAQTDVFHGNYRAKVRADFIDNLSNSDYILCCRGQGNYSYRLYETLSAGRIPIIIDTDIVLPHEKILRWKQFSIWIKPENIPEIGKIVRNYHDNILPEDFIIKQKECRIAYENYIRPLEFFKTWFYNNSK